MGTKANSRGGLADALFTRGQQRVLGILFAQPDRSFPATELIRLAEVGTGAVHRELTRLVESDLVTVTPVGKQRRYQANRESPLFFELHSLVLKTVGLAEPLRQALAGVEARIQIAFVYGSVARGTDTAGSDLDLMVIADDLTYGEIFAALEQAEAKIARKVNPTILTPADWQKRRTEKSHFVERVAGQPKVFIVGSEDDLA